MITRFVGRCWLPAAMVSVMLLGSAARPAAAQSDATKSKIRELQEQLRNVSWQLTLIRRDLARDASIYEARKASVAALAAYGTDRSRWEQATSTYAAARGAVGKAKMAHGKRVRSLINADVEARGLLTESERLEALARAVDAKIAVRRKAMESTGAVAARKKAWTDAQARVVETRKAYEKALKDALASDPQMKQLSRDRSAKWRDYGQVRGRLNVVKRLLVMGRGPLLAQRAYDSAVASEKKTYRAKLTSPDGGKTLKIVESLGPKLGALRGQLGLIYRKINETAPVKAAKVAWDRARTAAQNGYKNYVKARDGEAAKDASAAALLRQLKQAKDPKQRAEITRKLLPHRARANQTEKVIRVRKVYHDLMGQETAKRDAFNTTRSGLVAADPDGRKILAEIKRISTTYDPAAKTLGGYRNAANKDPGVIAAREKVVLARAKLVRVNAAYNKALDARVAARPEAKKLLAQRKQLEAKLKALTK